VAFRCDSCHPDQRQRRHEPGRKEGVDEGRDADGNDRCRVEASRGKVDRQKRHAIRHLRMGEVVDEQAAGAGVAVAVEKRDEAEDQAEDDLVAPFRHPEQGGATEKPDEADQPGEEEQDEEQQRNVVEILLDTAQRQPDAGRKVTQRLDIPVVLILRLVVETGDDRQMIEIAGQTEDETRPQHGQRRCEQCDQKCLGPGVRNAGRATATDYVRGDVDVHHRGAGASDGCGSASVKRRVYRPLSSIWLALARGAMETHVSRPNPQTLMAD